MHFKTAFFSLFFLLFFLSPAQSPNDFVTTWKTDNPGTSNGTSITIPTFGIGYNYDVDWNNDGVFDEFGLTGDITHDFGTAGTYTIRIKGEFPQIYFNNSGDKDKLLSIDQWGNQQWRSMNSSFWGCTNFTIQAADTPDLSACTSMLYTFRGATTFNQNINNWDVSNISDMQGTFNNATNFNQPLNNWDTSNVTNFDNLFINATAFNQDISAWNTGKVNSMYGMFNNASSFNQPLNTWDTSNVTNMGYMFYKAGNFNQPLNNWNTPSLTRMESMFRDAIAFNQNINTWNVSKITSMREVFYGATHFNQPLNNWDTSNVTRMDNMFRGATSFNQDINTWDVGKVTNMTSMFSRATNFNQPLNNWDTSSVTDIRVMFYQASSFNQPLDNWILSGVTDTDMMFQDAVAFNQDLSSWDMSNIQYINQMLRGATSFDRDLSTWNIGNVVNANQFLLGAKLSLDNYDALLIGWQAQPHQSGVPFSGGYSTYCQGEDARNALIADGWSISDGGLDDSCVVSLSPDDFVTTWKTDNLGTSGDTSITIPTFGTGYNYDVDWNNDGVFDEFGLTGNVTHDFGTAGTYTIRIQGDFPQIYFNNSGDKDKFLSVDQWGKQQWRSMAEAFYGCTNFTVQATDTPDLSVCASMQNTFRDAVSFNQNINDWDVSNITQMNGTFNGAYNFNQPLNNWDTSNVTTFNFMFNGASAFNQDLSAWNTSKVTNMYAMFKGCTNFNQPLNTWDISNVTTIAEMFSGATNFNQALDNWNTAQTTNMYSLFKNATTFNQNINSWDTGNVTDMSAAFSGTSAFNQPLDNWNVSNVKKMNYMFSGSVFNRDISNWDTRNVTTMEYMFNFNLAFNQAIGNWNVSSLTNIAYMFYNTPFNQDLSNWDTSKISNMLRTFANSDFDQNIGSWNISSLTYADRMFENTTLSVENYDALLIGWQAQTHNNDVQFGGGNSQYCQGEDARNALIADGWIISDNGLAPSCSVPGCTQLSSPPDGETNVSISASLNWDAVNDATGYYLTVGTTSGGNDILNNFDAGNTTTYTPATDWQENTTYYVTVTPYNNVGTASNCTETSFTTETLPTPPECTSLISPADGETNVSVSASLTWNAVNDATGYYLTVGTTSGGNDVLDHYDVGNTTTYTPATDWQENTTYYVTVTPYNNVGAASSCTETHFTTETLPTPPECTTLTNPADGETNVSINASLTWNAVSDATGYYLTVGTSSGGNDVLDHYDTGNTTTYTPATNWQENTTYYVTVTPYNNVGTASNCNETHFTSETLPTLPECTSLISPADGETNVSVSASLTWNAVNDATGYYLTVGTTSGGNDVLDHYDVGNTTTYPPATNWQENTTYYVTVTPYNNVGTASNCTETHFTTEILPTPPECTSLTSPADGETNVSVSASLTWEAVNDATGYYLTVGTTSGGNDVLDHYDVGNTTTYPPATNWQENTTYYVTVTPYNNAGTASNCTETSFTTETLPTPPECTSLTSPADGETNVSVSASLTWNAVNDATGYYLTVGTTSEGNDVLDNFDAGNNTTYTPATNWQENTTYYVTITPYNNVGTASNCNETHYTTETLQMEFFYPSFFTPNGNGKNDFWNIDGDLILPGTYIYIFDRYGKIVYKLKPGSAGWNGTNKNGALPVGEYWFKAELKNGQVKTGNFSLIR